MALLVAHYTYLANYCLLGLLTSDLFVPWSDKTKHSNTCYFDHLGGIDLLVKLQEVVCLLWKNDCFIELYCFCKNRICNLCIVYANCAKNTILRRHVMESGGLNKCIEALLEASVDDLT